LQKRDKEENNRRSGRLFLTAAVLLIIILMVIITVSLVFFRNLIRESAQIMMKEEENKYKGYYVLITGDDDEGFWQGILQGAKQEAAEEGIYLEQAGEALNTQYTKTEQLEMAIYSKVDGIILDAGDDADISELIKRAYAEGIPVVTVRNDSPGSGRVSFINISNANLGKEYGRQICRLAGQKEGTVNVCVLMDSSEQNNGQNLILTGIQDYLMARGMDRRINLTTTLVHNTSVFSAEEEIRDLFLNSPDQKPADIMVCLNLSDTTCVSQTVVDYNRVGQVEIIGFYESETIRSALRKDIIQASITVDTAQMGRYCVEALSEYRESGYVSDYYAVGTSLLLSEEKQEGGTSDE